MGWMYKVIITVLWGPKLRNEVPEIDTFENPFLGSAGAGCCAEHVSGIIPSDSQDSSRYHYCPCAHMGKPRHRKQSHGTRRWMLPLETQVCPTL